MSEAKTILIDNKPAPLNIENVAEDLIEHALMQWQYCGKYAIKTGVGNNTNPFLRGISVWLILKALTTSGKIQNYRQQAKELALICKMSVRTLDTNIAWLKAEGLVHREGKNLLLHSYDELKRKYNINIKKRVKTIVYDTTNKVSLAEMLLAIGIEKMKEKWMQVYWNKLNQNPDEYKRLYDFFVFIGADKNRLQDQEYFRECHLSALLQSYEEEKPGQPAYTLLHKTIKANPDLNCTAATYANKLGYSDGKEDENGDVIPAAMSFCRLKYRLAKKGLIVYEKGHVNSDCRSRKDENIYHHRYVRQTQETVWFRPDQITIKTDAIYGQKPAA